MKILSIVAFDPAKAADIAKASDKAVTSTTGYKALAQYICLGNPFLKEIPPNSVIGMTICEVENENALAAVGHQVALAGGIVHRVPILEMKPGASAETERKLRG
jgi:hypothetical protein